MKLQNAACAALFAAMLFSCGGAKENTMPDGSAKRYEKGAGGLQDALRAIAELEREGAYRPGLAISESKIREEGGDHGGAVFAAFKELFWAYSYHHPELSRDAIREGLSKVRALYTAKGPKAFSGKEGKDAKDAVDAALLFLDERYAEAYKVLKKRDFSDEADSFGRWMTLAAQLESGGAGHAEMAAYGAIRARYAAFPAYWYHGARTLGARFAGEYAERCINAAPAGRYAAEARAILAESAGLERADGAALRSRLEIEEAIAVAVAGRDPELLLPLLPLITLDDNPWTLFARGALRSLAAEPRFKSWIAGREAAAENGGAAEARLARALRALSQG
jgi:hypothetical protein